MDVSEPAILEDRFRFLARASAALGSSLDYEKTLRTLARLCVPVLADWCAVDLTDSEGGLQRLAVMWIPTASAGAGSSSAATRPAWTHPTG